MNGCWRPLAAVTALVLVLSGCAAQEWAGLAGTQAPAPRETTRTASPPLPASVASGPADSSTVALIATLRGPTRVLTEPDGALLTVQDDRTDEGTRQTLLVLADRQQWLEVALPGRPNGRTGWLRAGDVDLSATDWRVKVSLRARTLTVLRGGLVYGTHRVAVGKPGTPTPRGTFYVTDLLAPPDPAGSYGPFAFGLSAYSNVITSFGQGGRGQIGLHGTDEPGSIGLPVSSGCLRLDNDTIRTLAAQLPLGTPFEVVA